MAGGRAVDAAGEPGDCKSWFLGSGLPTTTTTVRINRTNDATVMYAVAITVTASGATEVHLAGIVLRKVTKPPRNSPLLTAPQAPTRLRYAGGYSGLADIVTAFIQGANSTALVGIDVGARVANTVRETTAGQGSRSVGFVGSGSDDLAAVHLAIKESAVAGGADPYPYIGGGYYPTQG